MWRKTILLDLTIDMEGAKIIKNAGGKLWKK
jgi:hypothetical protein